MCGMTVIAINSVVKIVLILQTYFVSNLSNLVPDTVCIFSEQVYMVGFQDLIHSISYTSDIWGCYIFLQLLGIFTYEFGSHSVLLTFVDYHIRVFVI